MIYFNTLPKVLTTDQSGNLIVLTNLLTRVKVLDSVRDNFLLFYEYDIQDGDTPEALAEKYYKDPYKYWIILHVNNLLDPLWNWPLPYGQFEDYLNEKYKDEAALAGKPVYEYVRTTIHGREKIITTIDSESKRENVEYISVDETTYNGITESSVSYTLPDTGFTCTVNTTKRIVYLYDYENELNESKRRIRVLNADYVGSFEDTFKGLMSNVRA